MTNLLNGLISREDISVLAHSEGLNFDDEERVSILETMRSIDVQACPGSGKTTLIAAKLILLAKKWPLSHQGICVLSHTNVAKDEIIERLKKSKTLEARRLLSYPHFIGTIQEFTGKFAAFPYLRSKNIDINCVDTDLCVDLIYSKISHGTRTYVDRKSEFSNVLYDFDIKYENEKFIINVPTFGENSTSPSYGNLRAVRRKLISEGYFFYRDVFTFAQMALSKNIVVPTALRKRFPCVFVDEMQDTQKFQDELLCGIFPPDDPYVIIQRFGDPDQAIFHGTGSDEPNESFNGKLAADMDYVVHKSHRFDAQLAGKIKPLSNNGIPLETELIEEALAERSQAQSSGESFEHSVIVFNDDNIGDVLQFFGNIVSSQFHEEYKKSDQFVVKAVGAVGNKVDPNVEQLKIGHYWADYEKNKTKNNFKENSLIEVVRYCRDLTLFDWSHRYKLSINSILKLLRLAGKRYENGRIYTGTSLRNLLKADNNWSNFRKTIYLLLSEQPLNEECWRRICEDLTLLFGLHGASEGATQYLAYNEDFLNAECHNDGQEEDSSSVMSLPENMVIHPDGFRIQLSTIHGVKGETHDATLVMETRNYKYDISTLLNHIAGVDVTRHTQKTKIKFSRQLYVAASRPRHLLCFAIHTDRIEAAHKEALVALGWKVKLLSEEELRT
jgi:DNA helicase-2/ATP-dependent DNA helicase PcrA